MKLHEAGPRPQWGVALALLVLSACGGGSSDSQPLPATITAAVPDRAETGQSVSLSPGSGVPTAGVSFNWDFGDGGTSSDANPDHAFAAPGTYDVTLTVSNAAGESRVAHASVQVGWFSNLPPTSNGVACTSGWCQQNPSDAQSILPGGGNIGSVFFIDDKTGWLIGSRSADQNKLSIWKTVDGGAAWSKVYQSPYAEAQLMQVVFADADNGWALDANFDLQGEPAPALLHTTDGGKTWQEVNPSWAHQTSGIHNTPYRPDRLQVVDANMATLDGYTTHDGGATWFLPAGWSNLTLQWSSAAWAPGDSLAAKPSAGSAAFTTVWHSNDFAATSTPALQLPCETASLVAVCYFNALASTDAKHAWVFGTVPVDMANPSGPSRSQMWRTVDGGTSWSVIVLPWPQPTGHADNPGPLFFIDANVGWFLQRTDPITFGPAALWRTVNGGSTWTQVPLPPGAIGVGQMANVRGARVYDASTIAVFVIGGTWLSLDAGAHWELIASLPFAWWTDGNLFFDARALPQPLVYPTLAWNADTIQRSTDGGRHWSRISGLDPSTQHGMVEGLWFADAHHGIAVTSTGALLNTSDGGVHWARKALLANSTNLPGALQFATASDGFWVHAGTLNATHDGGVTWTAMSLPGSPTDLDAMQMLDQHTGWILSRSGVLYATQDGGADWEVKATLGFTALGLRFASATTGVVIGADGKLHYTADGGHTWSMSVLPDGSVVGDVSFVDANTGWAADAYTAPAGGGLQRVLKTTDGGKSWSAVLATDCPSVSDASAGIIFADAKRGWVLGGGVCATVDGGTTWHLQQVYGKDDLPPMPEDRVLPPYAWKRRAFFLDSYTGWLGGRGWESIWFTATGGQP